MSYKTLRRQHLSLTARNAASLPSRSEKERQSDIKDDLLQLVKALIKIFLFGLFLWKSCSKAK